MTIELHYPFWPVADDGKTHLYNKINPQKTPTAAPSSHVLRWGMICAAQKEPAVNNSTATAMVATCMPTSVVQTYLPHLELYRFAGSPVA